MNRKPNRGGGRFNKPANRGGGRGRGGGGKGNTGDSARGDKRGKIFIVNDTPQRPPQQHVMPGSGGGGLISMSDSSQDMIEDLLKNLKEEGSASTDGELAKGNLGSGAHDGLFEELVRMGFQEQDVARALAVTQDRNAALDYLCVGPLYIISRTDDPLQNTQSAQRERRFVAFSSCHTRTYET